MLASHKQQWQVGTYITLQQQLSWLIFEMKAVARGQKQGYVRCPKDMAAEQDQERKGIIKHVK